MLTKQWNSKAILHYFEIQGPLYTVFPRAKKKKNGQTKVRWISAPNPQLKTIQKLILRRVLYRFSAHPCAHAYVIQKNIRSNANEHRKHKYTIVLDLKDFFPSITEEMLRSHLTHFQDKFKEDPHDRGRTLFCWDEKSEALLEEHLPLECNSLDVLLTFCTENGALPQGAPTSGALSNIVMYPLDCLFEQASVDKQFVYTRYADDLAFSGDDLEDLKKFVFGYVFRKIEEAGFQVNKKKVHVFQEHHKLITGLNVHPEGTRPCRKYRRLFRAKLANIRKEILNTSNAIDLLALLKKTFFLRSYFGHLWYQMYTESYNDSVEILAKQYFSPIREHLTKFFPTFSTSPVNFKSTCNVTNFQEALPLKVMQAEFYKLFNTGTQPKKEDSFGSVARALCLSYREKRSLITQEIQILKRDQLKKRPKEEPSYVFTIQNFQKLFRVASPEDRIELLLLASRSSNSFTLWNKIVSYTCRLGYSERLAIVRVLAEDSSLKVTNETSVLIKQKWILLAEKLLRSIMLKDMAEFITSNNWLFRMAAKKHITLKNTIRRTSKNSSEISS